MALYGSFDPGRIGAGGYPFNYPSLWGIPLQGAGAQAIPFVAQERLAGMQNQNQQQQMAQQWAQFMANYGLGKGRLGLDASRLGVEAGLGAGNLGLRGGLGGAQVGMGLLSGLVAPWEMARMQMPTAAGKASAIGEFRGPQAFLQGVQERGLYGPGLIDRMSSRAAEQVGTGLRADRLQTQQRAAASGYKMPWLFSGGLPGLRSGGALKAMADTRTDLEAQNQATKLQAAQGLGGLAGALAGLHMAPTRPEEAPGYVTDAVKRAGSWLDMGSDWMGKVGDTIGKIPTSFDIGNLFPNLGANAGGAMDAGWFTNRGGTRMFNPYGYGFGWG